MSLPLSLEATGHLSLWRARYLADVTKDLLILKSLEILSVPCGPA